MRHNSTLNHTAVAAALAALMTTGGAAMAEGPVTIVLPEVPAGLEPCRAIRSDISYILNMNITETLTINNVRTGAIDPHLATSWEQVDDHTWVFHLQEGVTFHDGAPFDAEAVAYAIERLMNPNLACDGRSKFGDIVLTPTALDELTLEIRTDTPNPIMPTLVSTIQIGSPNLPFDAETADPVGTGPYIVDNIGAESVVLSRWDDYWGPTPEVTEVTYVWRGESAIRAAMIATGEADLTPVIAVQDATNSETDFAYLNSETSWLRIDMAIPPLDDIRIRRALNLAVDWDNLGPALFGEGVLRAAQTVPPGTLGFNDSLEPFPFDPDQARALVEEAGADGVPVDTEIEMIVRNNWFPNDAEAAEAMAAMFQDVGLNVRLVQLENIDWVRYLDKPFPEGRGPTLLLHQHDNNTGDAGFTVPVMFSSGGSYSTVDDAALDEVIAAAVVATGEERDELFQETFRMVREDIVPGVIMYHMIGYVRASPQLDWEPDLLTVQQIRVSDIVFRD